PARSPYRAEFSPPVIAVPLRWARGGQGRPDTHDARRVRTRVVVGFSVAGVQAAVGQSCLTFWAPRTIIRRAHSPLLCLHRFGIRAKPECHMSRKHRAWCRDEVG